MCAVVPAKRTNECHHFFKLEHPLAPRAGLTSRLWGCPLTPCIPSQQGRWLGWGWTVVCRCPESQQLAGAVCICGPGAPLAGACHPPTTCSPSQSSCGMCWSGLGSGCRLWDSHPRWLTWVSDPASLGPLTSSHMVTMRSEMPSPSLRGFLLCGVARR